MVNKNLVTALAVEGLKTAIILFTLLLISRFIETLPFSGLPVFNGRITAAELLVALVSAASIAAFIKAGFNAAPAVDELLPGLPGAGALLNYLAGLIAALFAYPAFQPSIFPFITDFEWIYQSLFLAVTLFLLAKAGLLVYRSSETLSRFIISALQAYKKTSSLLFLLFFPLR